MTDREKAIKMLKSKMDGHTDTSYEWTETVRMAIKALEREPCCNCIEFKRYAKEMGFEMEQEPKTGHWIEGKYKDTCNRCRCTYPKNIGFKNFCPNCGAKMDKENKDGKEI